MDYVVKQRSLRDMLLAIDTDRSGTASKAEVLAFAQGFAALTWVVKLA